MDDGERDDLKGMIDPGLEDRRQLEHLAPVGFAFLLPYLPYWAIVALALAAVGHALVFSPRLIRVTTRRDEAARGFSPGKLYYALGVLCLVLVFHDRLDIAAAVWGILAAGDSFSNWIGRRLGGRKIPYNRNKSWAGFFSFWLFGGLAGWALAVWNAPSEAVWGPPAMGVFCAVTALLCAVAESLPPALDDNLAIAWVGGLALGTLTAFPDGRPEAAAPWIHAAAANLAAAAAARLFGWLSWRGTALAVVYGMAIYGSMGLPGFATMAAFLILASISTQVGFERKAGDGVAQSDRGRRGVANILANGLVALVLALIAYWLDTPLIRIAYCGAVATAAFDTVSTEIGQWIGGRPYNPITWRAAPVGTPGAVSLAGTAAGMAAGLAVGSVSAALGWLPWTAVAAIGFGATAGALWESGLAALFRYDFPYSDEALNLYSTLFGAGGAALLWVWLAG